MKNPLVLQGFFISFMSITNMSDRATCWSVTINNPVTSDEESIARARQKGWWVEGQLEKGENGTPHYQLIVKTPQVRFSAVKKAFPRAHIEVARNPVALASYVKKEETREGDLPASDKYPSLTGFYKVLVPVLFNIEDKNYRIKFSGGWYTHLKGRDHEQSLLDVLDMGASILIRQGYHVETLVVNPQTRSAWKRFGMEIIDRTIVEMSADRQTDRQTVKFSVAEGIPSDGEANKDDTEGGSVEDEGTASDGEESGCFGSDSDGEEYDEEESSVAGESDLEPDGGD